MPQVGGSPPLIIHVQSSTNLTEDVDQKDGSQKRKRVTRACDECRKKKVKCDGQQPCIHCTVYSYDCTYDRPSNRKKTTGDINLTQQRLKNAEGILQLLVPDLDINDAGFNYEVFENTFEEYKKNSKVPNFEGLILKYQENALNACPPSKKSETSSPVSLPKVFQQDDSQIKKKFKSNPSYQSIDVSSESKDDCEIKIILPPKEIALELVAKSWAFPCVLFRFYHRPTFIKELDELYASDPENYTNKQNSFLPLAYSVLAVGALFSKKNGVDDKFLEDEGYKYFVAARRLIDITDARDLRAIQTIVMLILFLQCSARLSTCYSYIGVALRSALREGLHRKVEHHSFNPIEVQTRKRLFWTIYKMDIYVNTMLGLPRSISPSDIDQNFPLELDDENITETGYLPQQPGKLSSAAIANNHTNLIIILNNIVKNLYPVNTDLRVISHEKVSEMELELRGWLSNLPRELIPGYDPPYQYLKANRLLHLSFLHVQIVLYRPFIHYVSPKYTKQANVDPLSIQRANNCISVARTVVNLAQDMIDKSLISGSYWFSIYTIFFSVACLVYYVHEVPFDPMHPDYSGIRKDAEKGKEILTALKDSSTAASRIYSVLNQLFEKLNRKTSNLHKQRQEEMEKELQKKKKKSTNEDQVGRNSSYPQFDVPNPQELVKNNQNNNNNNNSNNNNDSESQFQQSSNQPNYSINNEKTYNLADIQQVTSPYPSIKLEETYYDFDHLSNFDNFINQPLSTSALAVGGVQNKPEAQSFVNLEDSSYSNLGTNTSDPQQPSAGQNSPRPEDTYMPGMMDQLEMQIFGRFLPPYMMKSRNGSNNGPGSNGGDLPSGLNTTSNPKSLRDLSLKNSQQSTPVSSTAPDDNFAGFSDGNDDSNNGNGNNGFSNLDNWTEINQYM